MNENRDQSPMRESGPPPDKTYLGDGVYATHDEGQIMLTTEHGLGVDQKIFLEPDVLAALVGFAQKRGVLRV